MPAVDSSIYPRVKERAILVSERISALKTKGIPQSMVRMMTASASRKLRISSPPIERRESCLDI